MLIIIKTILVISLAFILYQDYRDREVNWFLFPITALGCGYLFYDSSDPIFYWHSIIINILLLSFILLTGLLVNYLIFKHKIPDSIGLGDILMFICFVFGLPPVGFLILFVFSLCFSLALHLVLKKSANDTVPLAGYMSLFLAGIFALYWSGLVTNLYYF